jgi:CoA:oxalate CoA-transferase
MTDAVPAAVAPLAGVRVLDFTSILAGPFCTRLLADAGAEVIKIETAEGDHKRTVPPIRVGRSTPFAQANAGKLSVVLDLKSAEGAAAARDLARTSQVVVENWRPGVAKRLRLDYASLAEINPSIIHCAISGYGQEGPDALRPALAPILHARSGYEMAQMAYQDGADRPAATGIFLGDVVSGISAFGAIGAALYRQRAHGVGASIDVSMFDVMLTLLVYEYHQAMFEPVPRRIFPPLRARDGFVVVAPVSSRNFENAARAMGHPEWIDDPRFATPSARVTNWRELMSLIERWTSERDAAECERLLIAGEVPASRYYTVAENLRDMPHLRERGSLAVVRDAAGDVTIPAAPFQFADRSVHPRPTVPELGSDTVSVLRGLGYSDAQIAAVRAAAEKGGVHGHL